MKRLAFFFALLLCASGLVCSVDFGLLLTQEFEGENEHFKYVPAFTPWFSWDSGKKISIYLSNRFFFEYHNYTDNESAGGWAVPVFRTELTYSAIKYHINENMSLEGGRIEYDDAIGFAATGLFDGVRLKAELPKGAINIALFYTGLLYRETALILMTDNDIEKYIEPWDWGDNLTACFASRRFLAAARWDMPLPKEFSLSAEFLAQFDLNDDDEKLHSQYIEVTAIFNPISAMEVSGGVIFEAMQGGGANNSGGFGFLAGMKMDVPGSLKDMLKINLKFTTGPWNDDSIAFTPISCVTQGEVFPEILSGLFYPSAGYSVRLHQALLAEGSFRYYISTYSNPALDGNLYGGELWASLSWQPVDDIRFKVGGGVFLPGMGNAYPKDTDPMWLINALLTLSL